MRSWEWVWGLTQICLTAQPMAFLGLWVSGLCSDICISIHTKKSCFRQSLAERKQVREAERSRPQRDGMELSDDSCSSPAGSGLPGLPINGVKQNVLENTRHFCGLTHTSKRSAEANPKTVRVIFSMLSLGR